MTSGELAIGDMAIGDLAAHSGIPASALRFYERQGLIHSRRTSGNQRRYRRDMLPRIAFIRASQSVGIPLSSIREVLGFLPEGAAPNREFWSRASQCWGETLNKRIASLQRLQQDFIGCAGCGCLAFDRCALVHPGRGAEASAQGA